MRTKTLAMLSVVAALSAVSSNLRAEVAGTGPARLQTCGLFDHVWNSNCRTQGNAPTYNPQVRRAGGYTVAVGSRGRSATDLSDAAEPRSRTTRVQPITRMSSDEDENHAAAWSSRRASGSTFRGSISCTSQAILKTAKQVVARRYGNRSYSAGRCARGVRSFLDAAGLNRGGGLGHAIDYHDRPGRAGGSLVGLGFSNHINQYPTPESAPPGAILVFSGPLTPQYLRTGRIQRGASAGSSVGHVTVKGDDGFYYTDGRTARAAVANRRLVGVYIYNESRGIPRRVRSLCN